MPGSRKTEEIVQGFVGWTWLNKNRRTYYKELMGSLFSTKEISMKEIRCCFIKEQYFIDNSDFINMLDSGNVLKQSQCTHLCIELKIGKNKVYVPLRNNLGESLRKFGKIGFSVPSVNRPKAGLDYRYSLIVNDERYIEKQSEKKMPNAQYKIIEENYELIEREVNEYINKYIKAARKNRHKIEPLFRVSSLINFHKELGVTNNSDT